MVAQGVRAVTTARNGISSFIPACKRLDLHYCDWAGSSRGMNAFLTSSTPSSTSTSKSTTSPSSFSSLSSTSTTSTFQSSKNYLSLLTTAHPSVEFRISPRPHHHPVLRAHYINGREKAICVKNMTPVEIWKKAEYLLQNSGLKNRKIRGRNVQSGNENVRGIWSPLHGERVFV